MKLRPVSGKRVPDVPFKGIISGLIRGEVTAFDLIFEKYSQRVFQFSYQLLKNKSDAEGVVQEVFLKLWTHRHRIDPERSFEAFLFTIVNNCCVSLIRKRSTHHKYIDYIKAINLAGQAQNPAKQIEFQEFQHQVEQIINALPPRQREIYLLSREEGFSYREIANKLSLSINTVENHMVRALKYIRERLEEDSLISLITILLFC